MKSCVQLQAYDSNQTESQSVTPQYGNTAYNSIIILDKLKSSRHKIPDILKQKQYRSTIFFFYKSHF